MPLPVSGDPGGGGRLAVLKAGSFGHHGVECVQGHPSGERELTAGYIEAVWDGDKSGFIQKS